ncbi:hypothetical protein [Lacicoccus qingdaonensis]|uniref:Uncharacterized protein n=1 Tax=Lacicoccus qingdaonensis TaxID=576118 RepID=A0A1G9J7R1_9BACL|nr:hypothetical protein [Salinicoccus qingdaonensis]SDL33617.1 hypothetical protein SAMN05216216_1449 [Salinicoccus qingdaonensis]
MKISFENIKQAAGYIKVDYQDENHSHFIEFKLNVPIFIREDLIALALATLCGTKYDEISMELTVSKITKENIEKFTKSELFIKTNEYPMVESKSRDKHTLNFSGGFDSLASLPFLPQNSSLVSMNFGGPFQRELAMIKKFDSHIVTTNILETDFRKNSWLFMLIASILYKDYLDTTFNISGGVIGAGFLKNSRFITNYATPSLITAANMKSIPYTLSLSEIAAIKIASQNYPHLMDDSLVSLANPKEEKRFRKQLLLEIEIERSNLDISIPNRVTPPKQPHFNWGDNILLDHLALYIMKYRGYDTALLTVNNIPEDSIKLVDKLELSFYDRYFTDVLKFIPKKYHKNYMNTLIDSGIRPFEKNDWYEYSETLNFLSKYHNIIQ